MSTEPSTANVTLVTPSPVTEISRGPERVAPSWGTENTSSPGSPPASGPSPPQPAIATNARRIAVPRAAVVRCIMSTSRASARISRLAEVIGRSGAQGNPRAGTRLPLSRFGARNPAYSPQSATKTLVSFGSSLNRFEQNTRRFPSRVNIGNPSKSSLRRAPSRRRSNHVTRSVFPVSTSTR